MGTSAPDTDVQPLHPRTHNLIDPRCADWTEERLKTQENVFTRALWPSLADVSEDCLGYIAAEWKLLKPSALGSMHGHDLISPIQVAQSQLDDFTPAQSIERQQQKNGLGTNGCGCGPIRCLQQS